MWSVVIFILLVELTVDRPVEGIGGPVSIAPGQLQLLPEPHTEFIFKVE